MTDDRERKRLDAAAFALIAALTDVAERYGGSVTIGVTLQILATRAIQSGASRERFLGTVGKAYDTVARQVEAQP